MKPDKRKAFSDAEKAALLKSYQSSGKMKKQWCKENAIGLSTLHRWLRQEKNTITPQPLQCWVPVISAVPEKSKAFEIKIDKYVIPIDHQTDLNFLASVLKVLAEIC